MTSAFPVAFGTSPEMRAAALPHGGIVAIVRQALAAWCAKRGVALTPAGPLPPRALTAETLRVPMPLSWHGPLDQLAKAHDTSISGVVRLALAEMLDVRVRVSKARGDLREQSPERRAQAELDNMRREERAQQRRDAAEIAASRVCPACGAARGARAAARRVRRAVCGGPSVVAGGAGLGAPAAEHLRRGGRRGRRRGLRAAESRAHG